MKQIADLEKQQSLFESRRVDARQCGLRVGGLHRIIGPEERGFTE